MYPKKVHVAEARKVWLTMSAEDRAAALVAIGGNPWRRYFEAERHRNSYQYAPNMAAWLEKRRWEDDAYPKPLPRNAVTEDWDTGAGWINDDGTAKQFWQD